MKELSEEEVFDNDIDPLEALREIRRAEGVAEENLITDDSDKASPESSTAEQEEEDDLGEFSKEKEEEDPEKKKAPEGGEEEEAHDTDGEEEDPDGEKEDDDKEDDTVAEAIKKKFKANGQEFEFTQEEMLEQFESVFGKAMDYTNKTKQLAPWRRMISALESEKLTHEDLNLAIDALKGNKGALNALLKKNEIDVYDLTSDDAEADGDYKPKVYGKDDSQLALEEIANSISGDPEYKITVNVIDEQWDQASRDMLSSNPEMIKGLHYDIKTGVYDKVATEAMKMKVLDGNAKSDIEYYMLAGEKVLPPITQNSAEAETPGKGEDRTAQAEEDDFDQASSEAQRKRSASTTRGRADRKGVIDYLDDNDDDFDAWYEKTMASQ